MEAENGLKWLFGFIVVLFIVGTLVYALSIAGSNLRDAGRESASGTIVDEKFNFTVRSNYTTSVLGKYGLGITNIAIENDNGSVIESTNYTYTNIEDFIIIAKGELENDGAYANLSANYTYKDDTTATYAMANFSDGMSNVTSNISSWVGLGIIIVVVIIAFTIVLFVRRKGEL